MSCITGRNYNKIVSMLLGFPGGSAGRESTCNAADSGLSPGSGSSAELGDRLPTPVFLGFPSGSDGKESTCNAGDLGSIPGLERSPEGGNGYPLQHSCLENPHGQRSLADYSPWGHKESDTTEQLSIAQTASMFLLQRKMVFY